MYLNKCPLPECCATGVGGPVKRYPGKVVLFMASQMRELCGSHVHSARHNVALHNDRRNDAKCYFKETLMRKHQLVYNCNLTRFDI